MDGWRGCRQRAARMLAPAAGGVARGKSHVLAANISTALCSNALSSPSTHVSWGFFQGAEPGRVLAGW